MSSVEAFLAESASLLDTLAEYGLHPGLLSPMLSAAEQERLARLRVPQDRSDFLAVRLLTRLALFRRRTAVAPASRPSTPTSAVPTATWNEFIPAVPTALLAERDIRQRCPGCAGAGHGRPYVTDPEIRLSWAHSRGLIAVVIAESRESDVGIDCERERLCEPPVVWQGRPIPLSTWCRVESCVKAGWGDLDELLDQSCSAEGIHVPDDVVFSEGRVQLGTEMVHWAVAAPSTARMTVLGAASA
ncbi:4'-phosphopantetheinyl transferase family protein [Austwickia chelonae]|uniref:4'-phosphopantetheinyl transferase family protein n=1 Tax=Austwickia chelonae TaxID=100225 RepID=UPI000E2603F7|nr:hypothetical protein [Austwickia chelonae]